MTTTRPDLHPRCHGCNRRVQQHNVDLCLDCNPPRPTNADHELADRYTRENHQ